MRIFRILILFGLAGLIFGCTCSTTHTSSGSNTSCSVSGDCYNTATVSGYAIFSNGMQLGSGADIVIQQSNDSFATDIRPAAIINNAQGFVAVPYTFDVQYGCNASPPTEQVRAFQSVDLSDTYKAGNVSGRCDGTDNGNSTFTNVNTNSAGNVIIYLDTTGGL